MKDIKCPFCGSEKIHLETGTISLKRSGKYEPDTTICCLAQKKNIEFRGKRYGQGKDAPDIDELSKL